MEFTSMGWFVDCAAGSRRSGCGMTANVCNAVKFAPGLVTVRTSTDAQAVSARTSAAEVAREERLIMMTSNGFITTSARHVPAPFRCERPAAHAVLIDSRRPEDATVAWVDSTKPFAGFPERIVSS